jgi:hypothetical protein
MSMSMSVDVDCAFSVVPLGRVGRGLESRKAAGSNPDGLERMLSTYFVTSVASEASGGALDSCLVHEIEVHAGRHRCTPLVAVDEPAGRARISSYQGCLRCERRAAHVF